MFNSSITLPHKPSNKMKKKDRTEKKKKKKVNIKNNYSEIRLVSCIVEYKNI